MRKKATKTTRKHYQGTSQGKAEKLAGKKTSGNQSLRNLT